MIEESGLRTTDPRLQHCMDTLLDMQRDWDYIMEPRGVLLDREAFTKYRLDSNRTPPTHSLASSPVQSIHPLSGNIKREYGCTVQYSMDMISDYNASSDRAVSECSSLISRVFTHDFIVPEFSQFCDVRVHYIYCTWILFTI